MENKNSSDRSWISVGELSIFLRIPVPTIYSWTHKRTIPFKKVGKALRFDLEQIKGHFESSTIKHKIMPKSEADIGSLKIEDELRRRMDLVRKGDSNAKN